MKKHGKKYAQAKEKISETKQSKSEAIKTCQEVASAKFDESIDASFSLGIDPKAVSYTHLTLPTRLLV